MKKLLFILTYFFSSNFIYADGSEHVCVVTNSGSSGQACTASELGYVAPCSTVAFVVNNLTPPAGYVKVAKFEWFVNGVSVKSTNNITDPILQWPVKDLTTNVYCMVTYAKTDGITFSSPYKSTTFSPNVKQLDFPFNISTSTPAPNYGCSSSTVSYSLNETQCSGMFCDAVYNVLGNYNITWQAPAGCVQTSLTNKGSNVSFTPDANTAGVLTATIHLSCGYTETRTLSIVRGAEAPTFTATTVQACSPSTSISINPVCGAVDYTYSIVGNPGVTFSSNGQQLLRSSNTSVNISIAAGSSINTFKAIANFQGSNSSPESISSLIAGSQAPKSINGFFENGKKFDPNTQYTFSSTGTDWIVGGGTIISGQGTKIITVLPTAGRQEERI